MPSKEKKKEKKDDISQGNTMLGSFEPAQWELSHAWTEVVGKNLGTSQCKVEIYTTLMKNSGKKYT